MRRERNFRLTLLALLLCLPILSKAQTLSDLEEQDKLQYLDMGIKQFENAEYEDADVSFREVLGAVKVLPAEICYYFGANSYYLGKFKQSINWLNKYIELKGTSGQFFDECTEYLKKAQENYLASNNRAAETVFEPGAEIDYTVMPQIDCGPSGKAVCPVCKGQTVIIKRSSLGVTYRDCPYCDNHGNLSCDEYNLMLQGRLQPKKERSTQ